MIGKLKGIIDSYGDDHLIVDVNGVGYVVHCSARTLQAGQRLSACWVDGRAEVEVVSIDREGMASGTAKD